MSKALEERIAKLELMMMPELAEESIDIEALSTDELFDACAQMAERVPEMKYVDSWKRYPCRLVVRTMKNGWQKSPFRSRYVSLRVLPSFGGNQVFAVEEETLREGLIVLYRQMAERLTAAPTERKEG